MDQKKVSLYRREHFNAAHRLHNPQWDEVKNEKVFGKCNNPNYHGHNYELIVKVTGHPEPDTGFVVDLKYLSDTIEEEVLNHLDHKNLNLDVAHFSSVIPTVEHIAIYIYDVLRSKLYKHLDLQIRLYETPNNFAEYPAS